MCNNPNSFFSIFQLLSVFEEKNSQLIISTITSFINKTIQNYRANVMAFGIPDCEHPEDVPVCGH